MRNFKTNKVSTFALEIHGERKVVTTY